MGHEVIRAGKNPASWRSYMCLSRTYCSSTAILSDRGVGTLPGGGKNQGNDPGDGDNGRGAHARAHSLICSPQTRGLATVIRPLVLVSVVSNTIGEMHVLKF